MFFFFPPREWLFSVNIRYQQHITYQFTIHATSEKLQKPPIPRVTLRCWRYSTSFITSATILTLNLQFGSVVPHPSMYKQRRTRHNPYGIHTVNDFMMNWQVSMSETGSLPESQAHLVQYFNSAGDVRWYHSFLCMFLSNYTVHYKWVTTLQTKNYMSLQQISSNCITVHFFVLLLEAIQMQHAATHEASVTVKKDVNVQRNTCKKSCKEL